LPTIANGQVGDSMEFRLLVLVDEVEMDRKSIDPVLIKEQTIRDGEALAQQAQEGTFSIVLYVIALLSLSMAMWLLVVNRRIRQAELDGPSEDQTEEVLEEMSLSKSLPAIDSNIPPPMGLNMGSQPAMAPTQTIAPAPQPIAPQSTGTRAPPPLPPTGLPTGWTQDQWNHFGWQYVEAMKK